MGISKKAKLAFVTVLLGLVFGITLTEAALRIAGPSWLKAYMRGTNLQGALRYGSDAGWPVESLNRKFVRFKPGQVFSVKYYEYNTTVHTDSWGGRESGGDQNSGMGRILVPFLGDSFTFGLGVEDGETYVSLLNGHAGWKALNLGIPGSALPNQLDVLEMRHRELGSPRLYIFTFFVGNDLTDIMRYYGYRGESNIETEDAGLATSRWRTWMANNQYLGRSYLVQFLRQTLGKTESSAEPQGAAKNLRQKSWAFRIPSGKRIASSVFLLMTGSKSYESTAEQYMDLTLDRLSKLSRNLHFEAYFIVIPEKHQVESDRRNLQASRYGLDPEELDPNLPQNIIGGFLKKWNIQYVDVLPCLRDRGGLYYEHDDHLTAAGHKQVAACIAGEINRKITDVYHLK